MPGMRGTCTGWLLSLAAVAVSATCLGIRGAAAQGIRQATDAPKPYAPAESRKRFQLPEGFRIELVASEPQLAEPTGMCFDAAGRIYVCELHGYNLDGYYDIVALNQSGILDTAVRRIPASKEAEARANKVTYGTVKLLQDTHGNGRYDRCTVFADRLPPCYGVVPARDGVVVLCAPDIVFLADRDGDGIAEVRETLFTGFGVGEIWTRISNPRWGIDNWIYAASGGGSGGTIRGPHLKEAVQLGSTCFRFKPDGTQIEPVSGGTGGYGLAFDDWGDRFLCTNQQHALFVAPLSYHDLARNPFSPGLNPVVNICSYGHPAQLFPTSRPDPWRRKRGLEPEWVKFYGAAETSAGLFTSACAPVVYQAALFPEAYRGNHFSCEPAQNLVHRCLLEPRGAGFVARRTQESKEFLTSTDSWFRPVNLVVGPEGALYVVDMYREIIEDYSAIPRYLQQQYVESLVNGRDKGRIWRILAGDPAPACRPNLAVATREQLVDALASGNAWERLTAQRLLVERNQLDVIPALAELCRKGRRPLARLHALHTLDGLGALKPALVALAMADKHEGIRRHALALAERWLGHDKDLLARAVALTDDPSPKVRLQLALSLGESSAPTATDGLARLARRDGEDGWMQAAILSSVADRAGRLAETLLVDKEATGQSHHLIEPLAAVVGSRNRPEETTRLLRLAAGRAAADRRLLAGLAEGLKRSPATAALPEEATRLLERLFIDGSDEVKSHALQVASLLGLNTTKSFRAARARAAQTVLDVSKPVHQRLGALTLLHGAPAGELRPLQVLLNPRESIDLQLAAVRAMASGEDSSPIQALLVDWQRYTPRVQDSLVEALCSRQDRLPLLLDALESKRVDAASLPSIRQAQLRDNGDAGIRQRSRKIFSERAGSAERQRVLEHFRACLTLKPDLKHGQEVFEQQCLKCHVLNGRGAAVGPDLAAAQDRPDESLLVDVLDPSSTITAGYRTYTVVTRTGRVFTGVLAAETATSVTLRREKGEQDVILRRDIEEMTASAKSLMPDGLEKEIRPQDMADLIGYLRQALRPGKAKSARSTR